jgi:hypothetical protein
MALQNTGITSLHVITTQKVTYMDMSGQLHIVADLLPGKEIHYPLDRRSYSIYLTYFKTPILLYAM